MIVENLHKNMAEALPLLIQRHYLRRIHLVRNVVLDGPARINVIRVTPVKGIKCRDRWRFDGRRWEMISSGKVLEATAS